MDPRSFSLRGFLFACIACLALPALAVGLDSGAVDLPSSVTPEGVAGLGFLYIFRECYMRQARQLDAAIKALTDAAIKALTARSTPEQGDEE